jgi:sugar-specific transcriptional regulator TrmB
MNQTLNIVATLEKLNLARGEAQIYELLLKEGALKAIAISKRVQLGRTNTYRILDGLIDKGLITKSTDVGVTLYTPKHPLALQEYLFAQRQAIDAAQLSLTPAMEAMMAMFRLSGRMPGVYVFSGKEELARSYDQLLKEGLPIDIIMNRARFRLFLGDYNKKFVAQRMRKKIHTRVLTPEDGRVESDDRAELRQVRYLSSKLFAFDMDIKVTARSVVLTTLKSEHAVGVFISDQEIAKNFRSIFNLLWSIAREN